MKTPKFIIRKKKDEEEQRRLRRIMTANQLMNVVDIQNDIVYTRDNKLFVYLKLNPISLELLSESEKNIMGKKFTSHFSAIKKKYKISSVSRPVDVSFIIDNLKHLQEEAQGIRRQILNEKIKSIQDFTYTGEILEHQFFIIMWSDADKSAERTLIKSANEVVGYCRDCGMTVELSHKRDIVKFFNLFSNPNYAHLEDDVSEYLPFVH